jgi:hypothetical protein
MRSGKRAGTRTIRSRATRSPRASTTTSTIRKTRMSSQNPTRTSGKISLNFSQSKNVSRTSGQPWLVSTTAARPPITTTVDTAAIA